MLGDVPPVSLIIEMWFVPTCTLKTVSVYLKHVWGGLFFYTYVNIWLRVVGNQLQRTLKLIKTDYGSDGIHTRVYRNRSTFLYIYDHRSLVPVVRNLPNKGTWCSPYNGDWRRRRIVKVIIKDIQLRLTIVYLI